ncbi:alpha/beta fold hydrolase, partial [Amycolatopsis sp. SID8362]|uniref:thioesterase II family protein n=1 Tax=Amycolatopsis sp. SID8362 TaxID=2690346 RepID=UPI00136E4A28
MPAAIRTLSAGVPNSHRYLLFPPAGGTTGMFRHIADVASGAEVQAVEYPGRGDRLGARPPASLEELAEQVTGEVLRQDPEQVRRTLVIGFSMGAFVAFEVVQRLRTRCGPTPAAIVVVGAPAPDRRVRGRYAR